MAQLFLDNRFSDVTVYVGSSKQTSWKFPVHQMVLSASSPVFAAMFSGNYNESQNKEVIIDDICPHTFYKLLFFLYKDELNVSLASEAIDILQAADKYEVKKLISACLEKLAKLDVTLDNFWHYFTNYITYGDQLTSTQIKIKIFVFLDKYATSIINHENFALLSPEAIFQIVSRNTLQVSEIDLCNSLVHWAKMQCCAKQISLTVQNQRKVLGKALYQIRLLTLDKDKLQTASIHELLTPEESELFGDQSNTFPAFWDANLMSRKREKYWTFQQPNVKQRWSSTSTYFVFAKDTFIHSIEIRLRGRKYKEVTKVTVSTMSADGVKLTIKSDFYYDLLKSIVRVSSVYVKALTVYKIKVEPCEAIITCPIEDCWPWGYEGDDPVFFNICVPDVINLDTFLTADYWRTTFASDPDEIYESGVIYPEFLYGSCIFKLQATFC